MTTDPISGLLDLVGAVRRAGVPASPDRVQAMLRAADALGGPTPQALYWAGRLTLCASPDDIARFDAAFRAYLSGRGVDADRAGTAAPWARPQPERALFAVGADGTRGRDEQVETSSLSVRASEEEVLRRRDFAVLTAVERAEAARLLALLAPVAPTRRSRRYRSDLRGLVDARRSARSILRAGGEPARLDRRIHRHRPRRLVLLIDVSGSMAPYADGLLRFAHAAIRSRPHATEVFTIGTRLTRLTAALKAPDPDVALRAASTAIPDWRGGTRLGEALEEFLRAFGHRGMARRAVVVVFSDGWERGDAAPLAAAAARLSRLAYRVVWVSPHVARPGFAPLAGGIAAVLPHIDALVAGHSVSALEDLVKELVRPRG
jgi:uncharacterized protein with von Willebrand factor type A (vWA) domain